MTNKDKNLRELMEKERVRLIVSFLHRDLKGEMRRPVLEKRHDLGLIQCIECGQDVLSEECDHRTLIKI